MPKLTLPSVRHAARRVSLILFGLLASLLVIELGLQAAAGIRRVAARTVPSEWTTGARRVLCLGDSNTYGLYYDGSKAYPQVLERLWNAREGVQPIEVMNLGVPSTNSSKLRKELPRMLADLRPDLVTVMIGFNDYWTVPVPLADARSEPGSGFGRALWEYCRTYRLLYMLTRNFRSQPAESTLPMPEGIQSRPELTRQSVAEYSLGGTGKPGGIKDWEPGLRENLNAMARETASHGVSFLLLTYAAETGVYAAANGVIRETASLDEVPLLDLRDVFRPVCPQDKCPFLIPLDYHPTDSGYELIARTLAQHLELQMKR